MPYLNKIDLARQVKSYSGDTAILSGNTFIMGGFTGGTDSQFFGTVKGYDAVTNNEFVTYQQAIALAPKAGNGIIVVTGSTGSTISVNNGEGLVFDINTALTLDLTSKTIVSPTISPTWTGYNNDGVTPYTIAAGNTAKNIIVDMGAIVNLSATYQYPAPVGTGQTLPISVSGSFGTSLPGAATPSSPLNISGISSNETYSVTLAKPKSGLIVVGSQVQFPSGNDTSSDSISITYESRSCLFISSLSILANTDIQPVLNIDSFVTTRARTFTNVTAGVGQYTYYLLYNALGQPTNVIQNGALPVFSAFQFLSNVNITNGAGYTVSVIVMRSNATNAFSGATLAFS